jgi:ABC-type transport system substrate-binding protein
MRRITRLITVVAVVGMAMGTLAATAGTAGAASTTKSGGTLTMALDENLAGFNINTSAANEFVLQEILDVVWPQPYIINSGLKPVLNKQLLSSVKVATNPETITYNLNPKAVWQDGTPINADDFIYNWQAQSGNSQYTDLSNRLESPQRRRLRSGLDGRPEPRTVPQRDNGHRQVLEQLRRLAEPIHQPGAGPHRPDRRVEHRFLGSLRDHLG